MDSAGIQVVTSFEPTWGSEGRRIEAESTLRIGREAEGPHQCGSLRFGLLLADGGIVVADGLANDLRLFSSAGEHVRTFGRSGEAPGEFSLIAGVFDYRGDSLAVFDQRHYRTTVFSLSTGDFRTIRNSVAGNFVVFGAATGTFMRYNPGQFNRSLQPGFQWDSTDVAILDPRTGSSRVIARLAVMERLIGPGASREELIPFHGSIQAATSEGFYWATSDRYEITLRDTSGVVLRILRRPVEPSRVEPQMIEAYVSEYLDWVRGFEGEEGVPRYRNRLEEARRGETVPLFGLAFTDGDGRLWVGESSFPSFQGPPRRWTVFAADGVLLGDVAPPEGVRMVDARGDTVLGIWRDELDIEYVQVHHIVGGTGEMQGGGARRLRATRARFDRS